MSTARRHSTNSELWSMSLLHHAPHSLPTKSPRPDFGVIATWVESWPHAPCERKFMSHRKEVYFWPFDACGDQLASLGFPRANRYRKSQLRNKAREGKESDSQYTSGPPSQLSHRQSGE